MIIVLLCTTNVYLAWNMGDKGHITMIEQFISLAVKVTVSWCGQVVVRKTTPQALPCIRLLNVISLMICCGEGLSDWTLNVNMAASSQTFSFLSFDKQHTKNMRGIRQILMTPQNWWVVILGVVWGEVVWTLVTRACQPTSTQLDCD